MQVPNAQRVFLFCVYFSLASSISARSTLFLSLPARLSGRQAEMPMAIRPTANARFSAICNRIRAVLKQITPAPAAPHVPNRSGPKRIQVAEWISFP